MTNENSNINENEGDNEKSQPLTPKEKEEQKENIIVATILWMTMSSLFILAIGIVWQIKDFFTTTGFADFLLLKIQAQIFIVGLILLAIFFLTLFLVVLFRRGKRSLHSMLFKNKYDEMSKDETYMPAKVITAGTLICIFTIFLGLIIAIFGFFLNAGEGDDPLNLWTFFEGLTMGSRILLVGGSVLILDGLFYGFVFTWVNGQWVVINQILKYNKEVEEKHTFEKNKKIVGNVTFGIIVAEVLMIVVGIIWAIIDAAFLDYGATFKNYPVGIQISFYGIFGAFLFTTLIFSMFFYKRGNNLILTALFVQISPKDIEKDNSAAKVITIGILISISMMVIGLIIWILSLVIRAVADDTSGNIFVTLGGMSGGLALLSYSVIAEIFTILALSFSFFLFNGYGFTMDKIIKMEKSLDEGIDTGKKKADERKEERKRLRKLKKEENKKEREEKKKEKKEKKE